MAGFAIGLGRALSEAGAGFGAGREKQEDLRWKQLNNQLLENQLKLGGLDPKQYLKNYMKLTMTRQRNAEIGQQWHQLANQLRQTDPIQASKYDLAADQMLGPDGMGSLQEPTQVALNVGIRQPDLSVYYKYAQLENLLNPKVTPYQIMGPGGETAVAGITQPLDLTTGTRTVTPQYLPPPGGAMTLGGAVGMPAPPMPAGAPAPPMPIPSGAYPPTPGFSTGEGMTGFAPTTPAEALAGPPVSRAEEAKARVAATVPGGRAPAAGPAAAPAVPPSTPSPAVTKVALNPPPPDRALRGPTPPPVPKAWGGAGYPSPFLRPKLTPQDSQALSSLDGVLHETDLLYRQIRAIPASVRRGALGSKKDWLFLKMGISGGRSVDDLLSQIGADKASLIAGFQGAGKTRAFAAIKLVQDHYPQLGDSDDLLLHKLEQLMRPDGYLTFARNAILYGPTAATAMAPISEPMVAPPGAVWDSQRQWTWKNGTKGMLLNGIPYRQDTDGYWVGVTPGGR